MKIVLAALLLYSLLVPSIAHTKYCVAGKVEAVECSGFIIESCKFIRVDAVLDDNGNLYNVKECYSQVSDYKPELNRCWITTKSKGGGLLSWFTNVNTQPKFVHKNISGEYENIDANYITFPCRIE